MWWVAQAMWSGLRRLCGGFCENNAKLGPTLFELGLRLSLAIKSQVLRRCLSQFWGRVQQDSWSWSRNSRLGLSRPSIGLGLDRISKSRPVLALVSFEILFQDKSWSWSCLKFSFKTSLGIGLERQKNQDKINTKQDDNEESKSGLPTWLVGCETYDHDFLCEQLHVFSKRKYCHLCNRYFCSISIRDWAFPY